MTNQHKMFTIIGITMNLKTSVNNKANDLKNAKKILVETTTQKISEKEALEGITF